MRHAWWYSMKVELKQHFRIESARFLPGLPESHPCRRMHGHSFRITLVLRGEIDPKIGWVRDYHEITKTLDPLLKSLDHHVLNEIPGLENPTSELLAVYLFEKIKVLIPEVVQVQISETADTECSYPVTQ
jgi:6-pyruvoyltetrahydropterin/6-carboxytetrahydropterin synthase